MVRRNKTNKKRKKKTKDMITMDFVWVPLISGYVLLLLLCYMLYDTNRILQQEVSRLHRIMLGDIMDRYIRLKEDVERPKHENKRKIK